MKIKETIKKELPKTTKGRILGIIFGVVTPIVVGIGAGFIINKFFLGKSADYSIVDESKLSINKEALMEAYNAVKSSGGEYSDALEPYQMVNIGYILYEQYEHTQSWTNGYVHAAMVTQSIRGTAIRDGNNFFEESLSKSSLVDVATRTYVKEDTSIDFYRGSADSEVTATWNPNVIPYTSEGYTADFGKTPREPIIYVINSYTLEKDSSTLVKENNEYKISLRISPRRGVIKYVKQMKSISDLADYPAFEDCTLSFTLDKDLLIKQMDVVEHYYARTKAGVGSDSAGYVTVKYNVGSNYHIPTLSEAITYPEA